MDFHTCSLFITLTVFLVYKVVVHGKNLVVIQQKQVFFLLVTHKQHQTQGIESGIFIFIWAFGGLQVISGGWRTCWGNEK